MQIECSKFISHAQYINCKYAMREGKWIQLCVERYAVRRQGHCERSFRDGEIALRRRNRSAFMQECSFHSVIDTVCKTNWTIMRNWSNLWCMFYARPRTKWLIWYAEHTKYSVRFSTERTRSWFQLNRKKNCNHKCNIEKKSALYANWLESQYKW